MFKLLTALMMSVSIALLANFAAAEPAEKPEAELIRVDVERLAFEPETQTPMVLLVDQEKPRYVPIFIGDSEAGAIWRYMNNIETPRPMTHDLITAVVAALGGEIEQIVVTEMTGGIYFAAIKIMVGDQPSFIDARPSDSIAVALKAGVPVYVTKAVFDAAGVPMGEAPPIKPKPDDAPVDPKDAI